MIPGTEPQHYCNAPREDSGVPLLEGPLDGRPRREGRESEDQPSQVDDDFLF
jgi:hypothetical protein